jgi:hypothetical protein
MKMMIKGRAQITLWQRKPAMVLISLALFMLFEPACRDRTPKTSCIYGNDIPDEELDSMMEAGNKLVALIEAQDYIALYEAGTELMKKSQTRDQFVTVMKASDDAFGKKEYTRLEEAYLLDSKARDDHVAIPCNLGVEGADDVHLVPANRKMAVLVYKPKADYGIMHLVIHLIWEDEKWKLFSVVPNPASIKGHLAGYYFNQARESREKNLLRLAYLQYQIAILLSDLGPNIEEFTMTQVIKEAQEIKVDYLPQNMVQIWETPDDNLYKVYNIGILVSEGKIYVDISYITSSLSETEKIEKEARDLIRFVKEKFPEYEQGFDGLVISARSEKPDEVYHSYQVVEHFH